MWTDARRILAVVLWALAFGPVSAQDTLPPPETDLGALPRFGGTEWLSDTVTRPHANIATTASRPDIAVMPIGATLPDAVGLLPASITGLPDDLWGASDAGTLATLFRAQSLQGLPAIQQFTETLALAELLPPGGEGGSGTDLFLARLDMLLARGALEAAQAMIERAVPTDPEVFRRWFDVSLLTDQASRACAAMDANPDIAPTFPARIFCLARGGDWSAAALSLGTGEALGRIGTEEADLIARFLDPELFEGEPPLPPDPNLTPLTFQMRVALGERPDTASLPLAFAHADLSDRAGWRAQLQAAERLTRSGAIAPTQWLEIYTDRTPSASGGVWDRVEAVQALDAAILAGDAEAVARHLSPAWDAMLDAGLETAFAAIFTDRLARLALPQDAAALARRIALLSPDYEIIAQSSEPEGSLEALAFAIARGLSAPEPADATRRMRAVAAAFSDAPVAHRYTWFVANDRLGEALLRASVVLSTPNPDTDDLTDALALFRAVGLEDVARRAALQLVLLEDA